MEIEMDSVCSAATSFSPRLWRTCRYLANVERMNVFRTVCLAAEVRGLDVNSVTRLVHLRQPATSTYLRQLAECGLVTRQHRVRGEDCTPEYGLYDVRVQWARARIKARHHGAGGEAVIAAR